MFPRRFFFLPLPDLGFPSTEQSHDPHVTWELSVSHAIGPIHPIIFCDSDEKKKKKKIVVMVTEI